MRQSRTYRYDEDEDYGQDPASVRKAKKQAKLAAKFAKRQPDRREFDDQED